jgi:hypothetical protein
VLLCRWNCVEPEGPLAGICCSAITHVKVLLAQVSERARYFTACKRGRMLPQNLGTVHMRKFFNRDFDSSAV